MKSFKYLTATLGFVLAFSCSAPQPDLFSGKIVDLTYSLGDDTIFWPTAEDFKLEVAFEGVTEAGHYYVANTFSTAEHGGTHIDAPIHFYKDGHTVDTIPLEQLMGKAVVIDVSDKCAENRDYLIQVEDFTAWEQKHGVLLDDLIVLLRTGFGKYWPDRLKYLGTDERGPEAVPKLHFPGLHPDAAKWIVDNRTVKVIGLDTPSIDYGQSSDFKSHVILYEKNIPAFENVANLDQLPEKDFNIIALPIKIEGGSGGPVRIVALIPE